MIAPTIYNPHRPWGGYFQPWYGGTYLPYGWANVGNSFLWGNYYTARYYNTWHCGFWFNYFYFPPGFVPRPIPLGWLLPPTVTWQYYNPYFLQSPTIVQYINYSQPLPAPAIQVPAEAPTPTPLTVPPAANPVPPAAEPVYTATASEEDSRAKQAAAIFDDARGQFLRGNYDSAGQTILEALKLLPEDPTLHEFRSLVLFAQGKYRDAAAGVYAVLAAGPGWNADTLYSLYPDKVTYAKQLASLEQHLVANPQDAAARFLLGYHYLTLGDKERALTSFDQAVKLEPKDEVSNQLAQRLREKPPEEPTKP